MVAFATVEAVAAEFALIVDRADAPVVAFVVAWIGAVIRAHRLGTKGAH